MGGREKRTMVLQYTKASGNRRDERIISRIALGHTIQSSLFRLGKHNTGRCDCCGQEEKWERKGPREMKVHIDLLDILQKDLNECYRSLFQYLRLDDLIKRIWDLLKIIIKTRHFDSHSLQVGGGNAPIRCLPTASNRNMKKKRKKMVDEPDNEKYILEQQNWDLHYQRLKSYRYTTGKADVLPSKQPSWVKCQVAYTELFPRSDTVRWYRPYSDSSIQTHFPTFCGAEMY